jgi:hypothetical protein
MSQGEETTGGKGYTVRRLEPAEYPAWDTLVWESPAGTLFQTSWWLEALCRLTGAQLEIVGCFDKKGALWGGCALYARQTGPWKRALFPPACPYNGMAVRRRDTPNYRRQMVHTLEVTEALAAYLEEHYSETLLAHRYELADVRSMSWRGWETALRYTYEGETAELKQLLRVTTRTRRQKFERAQELGYTCQAEDDITAFLPLYRATYFRHGLDTPLNPSQVEAMYRLARERQAARLFITHSPAGEPVSGMIILMDPHRCYTWLFANHPAHLREGVPTFTVLSTIAALAGLVRVVDHASANFPQLHRSVLEEGGILKPVLVTHHNRSRLLQCIHEMGFILGGEHAR